MRGRLAVAARLGFLLTLSVPLACSLPGPPPPPVSAEHDRDVDFSSYRTYRWSESPGLRSAEAAASVLQAVTAALARKGYQPVAEGTPDFGIQAHGGLESKLELVPVHQGGLGGASTTIRQQTYQLGTLVLDVSEPLTQHVVWRGSVTEAFRTTDAAFSSIPALVDLILERFPPQ